MSNKRRSLENDLEAREQKRERGVEEGRREGEVSEMTQRHGRARECGPRGATRRSGERDTITLCRIFLFAPKIEGFFPAKVPAWQLFRILFVVRISVHRLSNLVWSLLFFPLRAPRPLVDMRPETETLNTTPPSLCDMSEDILERIVSFLDPPSVYFLVTSSKALFRPHGSRLVIKASMTRRLEGVLADITSGSRRPPIEASYRRPFTVQDLFPDEERDLDFDASGRPQVLLSGSAVVQSVLGKTWEDSDIDIFCTWEAAPIIRRRLIDRCGLICSGVDNDYMQEDRDLAGDIEGTTRSVIHHVESYSSLPTREEGYPKYIDWAVDTEYRRKPFDFDEYMKLTKEWGAKVLEEKSFWFGNPVVGRPGGSLEGDFLYDFNLRENKFVQLIIGTQHHKDARTLLTTFDLKICKCAFTGRGFIIPAPADTFAGRTVITPARHDIVKQFLKSFAKLVDNVEDDVYLDQRLELHEILTGMTKRSWKGVGLGPYEGGIREFSRRYMFCTRLFQRLEKYDRRGIEITNAPDHALVVARSFPEMGALW